VVLAFSTDRQEHKMSKSGLTIQLTPHQGRMFLWILLHEHDENDNLVNRDMLHTSIELSEPDSEELLVTWATRLMLSVVRELRYNEDSILRLLKRGLAERQAKKDQQKDV
jgi:hypothetical protein